MPAEGSGLSQRVLVRFHALREKASMSKVIWMFSGQGSQYFGMGQDLYQADPVFRGMMEFCEVHAQRLLGISMIDIIHPKHQQGRSLPFDNLSHSHPALFCIQFSLAQTLLRKGLKPDLLLGYSLGEWVALTVSGALPFATTLEILIEQANLLKNHTPSGGMLAVMSSPEIVPRKAAMFQGTTIGAYNFEKHFVITGIREAIERAQAQLRKIDIASHLLPVKTAFHSPCMDVIEDIYKEQTKDLLPGPLTIPLVSLSQNNIIRTSPPDFLWNVLRQPVRFHETISSIEKSDHYQYLDIGPSGTLATLMKYTLKPESKSSIHPIMRPYQPTLTNLEQLPSAL